MEGGTSHILSEQKDNRGSHVPTGVGIAHKITFWLGGWVAWRVGGYMIRIMPLRGSILQDSQLGGESKMEQSVAKCVQKSVPKEVLN